MRDSACEAFISCADGVVFEVAGQLDAACQSSIQRRRDNSYAYALLKRVCAKSLAEDLHDDRSQDFDALQRKPEDSEPHEHVEQQNQDHMLIVSHAADALNWRHEHLRLNSLRLCIFLVITQL